MFKLVVPLALACMRVRQVGLGGLTDSEPEAVTASGSHGPTSQATSSTVTLAADSESEPWWRRPGLRLGHRDGDSESDHDATALAVPHCQSPLAVPLAVMQW
jgi:hypothetical protein